MTDTLILSLLYGADVVLAGIVFHDWWRKRPKPFLASRTSALALVLAAINAASLPLASKEPTDA